LSREGRVQRGCARTEAQTGTGKSFLSFFDFDFFFFFFFSLSLSLDCTIFAESLSLVLLLLLLPTPPTPPLQDGFCPRHRRRAPVDERSHCRRSQGPRSPRRSVAFYTREREGRNDAFPLKEAFWFLALSLSLQASRCLWPLRPSPRALLFPMLFLSLCRLPRIVMALRRACSRGRSSRFREGVRGRQGARLLGRERERDRSSVAVVVVDGPVAFDDRPSRLLKEHGARPSFRDELALDAISALARRKDRSPQMHQRQPSSSKSSAPRRRFLTGRSLPHVFVSVSNALRSAPCALRVPLPSALKAAFDLNARSPRWRRERALRKKRRCGEEKSTVRSWQRQKKSGCRARP